MAITPEQRLDRRKFVGSSDAPAIAGVDPYSSRLAVFMEKVYEVADIDNKGPVARGNRYEDVLLDWAAEELGVEVEKNVSVRHPTDLIHAANLDGRVRGKKEGIEAKFTGLAELFGPEGSDDIPEKVLVQTHHQMYCDDLEIVWVPVLLARFGRPVEVMYKVERNDALIEAIVARNHEFWESFVLPKIPPPLEDPPPLDVIRRVQRTAGAVVSLDASLVEKWEAAKRIKKDAEKAEEAAKAAVLAALGDAEIGDYGDPDKRLTYFQGDRAGYAVAPTKVRTPRLQKRF